MRPRNERGHRSRRALLALVVAAGLATACEPVPVPVAPTSPTTTAPTPTTTVPKPATTRVTCPSGATIEVSTTTATSVGNLLAAAKTDGLSLCGGGYRSPDAQIALRKQNCGTSYYAIWEMPSSQCNPPTAIPGTSMHEKGLAIDFTNCSTRTTACYLWLAKNASRFGLINLPSEPWHWSTNGR